MRLRSFRITVEGAEAQACQSLLAAEGYRFEPEPFSARCWRLAEEPAPLGGSLASFFGLIYIQDRSSMLPPLALAPKPGESVLDMCSSPGSKTGFLCQLAGPSGFVLANEASHSRLFTLRANLRAMNFLQAGTCSFEGQALPLAPGSLACIQLDPPCSGWGTVEKHPLAAKLWQGDKIKPLVGLQRLLLHKAALLLKEGGRVVYSTCTTNSDENERQVAWAEAELGLVRDPLEPFPGFGFDEREGSQGTLRVDGEKSGAQGFYVARLVKRGATPPLPEHGVKDKGSFQGRARPRQPKASAPLQFVPRQSLACASFDPARLPDGEAAAFAGTVRFLPRASQELLPEGFVWQAAPLGKLGAGGFVPDARLRCLMPADGPRIVLEEAADLRRLLAGTSMASALAGTEASLWWRDLPLGRVALRRGRVVAAFS